MRTMVWCWLLSATLLGQGTEARKAVAEYPASVTLARAALGGEIMGHTVTWRNHSLVTSNYLVIELAFFPLDHLRLPVRAEHFSLRLNGKKTALAPQWVGMVAASVKYPDWTQRGAMQAGASVGGADVTLGRPPDVARFPGDPTVRHPLPRPPGPTPGSTAGANNASEAPLPPEDLLAGAALPETETAYPISGYLYFPYSGKLDKLKTIELLYEGPAGSGILRLPPL